MYGEEAPAPPKLDTLTRLIQVYEDARAKSKEADRLASDACTAAQAAHREAEEEFDRLADPNLKVILAHDAGGRLVSIERNKDGWPGFVTREVVVR